MKFVLSLLMALSVFALAATLQPAWTPAQSNCEPAYPDFCIAPAPPDLDCADIGSKNFTVLPPDPHRFDRDKDGIGCEP
ncbi:excalibur calcium-binding domain-containing protein [Phormidium tenue FACHB-886]|nr:excalibur calcium-binding domain-containing protein [Phormidium tenue FACHB-886]